MRGQMESNIKVCLIHFNDDSKNNNLTSTVKEFFANIPRGYNSTTLIAAAVAREKWTLREDWQILSITTLGSNREIMLIRIT